jgi:glycosyltransferase involved in cell wall biosynthesis
MKILYDYQIFEMQKYGGISRYFIELMRNFHQNCEINYELSLAHSNNYFINQNKLSKEKLHLVKTEKTLTSSAYKFIGQMKESNLELTKKKLLKQDFDVFHPTYYNPYFLKYIGTKPFVLTIHDMIHEIFPEYYSLNDKTILWKKMLAEKANRIIAVSENTKKDIMNLLEISSNKIDVIYHGVSMAENANGLKNIVNNWQLPSKYILFVGARERYKNFYFFIKSLCPFLQKNKDIFVICAGGGAFSVAEMNFLNSLNIGSRVMQQNVNDEDLTILYKNAITFVFPSLYEGFGMPMLESFACGCPVIASRVSSLPEIGEDAAIYFDPKDAKYMRDSIEKVIDDEQLRENMRLKGYKRLKNFSWRKTSMETKNFYQYLE